MKLRAIRDFYYKNEVRGSMLALKKGDDFELDVVKDAEQIFSLIGMGRAIPTEERYVPAAGRYTVLSVISYEGDDGTIKTGKVGEAVTLKRETAIPFLVNGHVKPVDANAWHPSELIKPKNIDVAGEVKKMFDDLSNDKSESWITKGVKR